MLKSKKDCSGYPKGYKPKPIAEQTTRLRELFPGIGYADEELTIERPLPKKAEGWFAVPRWEMIGATYHTALQKVVDLLCNSKNPAVENLLRNKLGPEFLERYEPSGKAFRRLARQQAGYPILIVPAQFGLSYTNKTTEQVRKDFGENEFGLDVFTIVSMLLTHPERLPGNGELQICCSGDNYRHTDRCAKNWDHRLWSGVLTLGHYRENLRCLHWSENIFRLFGSESYGHPSGFLF